MHTLRRSLVLASAIAFAACGGGPPSFPTGSAGASPTLPSVAPTATTSASPTFLAFDDLPALQIDMADVTAICDPTPGIQFPQPGSGLIECADGLELGLRAIETATDEPISRAYLRLPFCEVAPCPPEQRNTGSVTAWTSTGAWRTHLDIRTRTATVPELDPSPIWPTLDAAVPTVERPELPMAPPELANRKPFPNCGHIDMGEPPGPCFFAQFLHERPVELSMTVFGTEGGEGLELFRFSGSGAIVVYSRHIDVNGVVSGWYSYQGPLIFGIGSSWGVGQLDDTYRELP